jgi:hypothetical protein
VFYSDRRKSQIQTSTKLPTGRRGLAHLLRDTDDNYTALEAVGIDSSNVNFIAIDLVGQQGPVGFELPKTDL